MEVVGESNLLLRLNGHGFYQSAIVADLGNISGILGLDFLARNDVTINTSKGVLSFPNFKVKLSNTSESDSYCARVQLMETVHIPAKSEMFVKGKIDGHYTGEPHGLLEPTQGFNGEKRVFIPKSVVNTEKNEVLFSIMNTTPESVTLKRNVSVASLQPFKDIMEPSFHRNQPSNQSRSNLPEHLKSLVKNVSDKLTFDQKNKIEELIRNIRIFSLVPTVS